MPVAMPPPPMPKDNPSERLPYPAGVPREVRLRVVTPEEASSSLPASAIELETERLTTLLRRARILESSAWSVLWFALGAGSLGGARGGDIGFWLSLAFTVWVLGIVLARKRARLAARLLRLRGEDIASRESLRARAALTSIGEALRGLASWADDAGAFIVLTEGPVSVDPSMPIPNNPIPRECAGTVRPGKSAGRLSVVEEAPPTPRVESSPPSHPNLARDPDHDPMTCRICNPVSSKPPFALMFGDSLRPTDSAPSGALPAVGPVSIRIRTEEE